MGVECCHKEFAVSNFGLCHSDPRLFVTPRCRGKKHAYSYIGWRIFWAMYHVSWCLYSGISTISANSDPNDRAKWFIYLTNWTYLILTIDSIIQMTNVIHCFRRRSDIVEGLAAEMTWYLKIQWVVYNVAACCSIFVTVIYWGLIYRPPLAVSARNLGVHALNSAYVLMNILVTAMPTRVYHFFHTALYGTTYVLFSVIYYYANGTGVQGTPYIYPMLDWRNPGLTTLLSVGAVVIAIPVAHVLYFGLYKLRTYIPHCDNETKPNDNPEKGYDISLRDADTIV